MTKAEEILKRHLKLKGCTNDHIHVAAYMSCIDAVKEALNLAVVSRSEPIKEETDIIDYEECVWENPAYEQTIIDIDKSLDYKQSIEDKTLS